MEVMTMSEVRDAGQWRTVSGQAVIVMISVA